MNQPKVIDTDGHIYESYEDVEEYFEEKYCGMRWARNRLRWPRWLPWHSSQLRGPRPRQGTRHAPHRVGQFAFVETAEGQPQEALFALREVIGLGIVEKYTFALARAFPGGDVDRLVDMRPQRHAAVGNAELQCAAEMMAKRSDQQIAPRGIGSAQAAGVSQQLAILE